MPVGEAWRQSRSDGLRSGERFPEKLHDKDSSPARWSSLRSSITRAANQGDVVLTEWPVPKPADWVSFVNQALTVKELEELRLSAQRGRPFGNESWKRGIAAHLGLESMLRPRGRPRKEK